MKSEERHQLEQNELADWVLRLVGIVRPYLLYMFVAAVVVVGVLIGLSIQSNAKQQTQQDAWREFFTAQDAAQFEVLLSRYPDSLAAPYTRLRIADLKFDEGKKSLITNRAKALSLFDESIKFYEELTKNSSTPSDVKQQAQFGVGLALESKGALEEAKKAYEVVVTEFSGSEYALRAQNRIKQIETPSAKEFYAALADYKPIGANTDLPPLEDNNAIPVPPPTTPGAAPTTPEPTATPMPPKEEPATSKEAAPPVKEEPAASKEAPPSKDEPAPKEEPAPKAEATPESPKGEEKSP
ncbi:MAG: hypothetical protein U1D30_19325 [Planctomycetota bacterium]